MEFVQQTWQTAAPYVHEALQRFVSPQCADTLVTAGQWQDSQCLQLVLSKMLGSLVILGAVIVKVPQIVALLAGKSAAGVSLLANLQELFVYTVIMSRAVRLAYPFSTWGEAFFIELQLLALVGIILYYNGRLFFFLPVLAAVAGVMYAVSKPEWVSKELLMNLQYYTVPIMLMSRLTQIVAVVRAKATGRLSAITSFMNFAGNAARVFTTLKEVNDPAMLTSFLLSLISNFVVLALFFIYPKEAKTQGKTQAATKAPATPASGKKAKAEKKNN